MLLIWIFQITNDETQHVTSNSMDRSNKPLHFFSKSVILRSVLLTIFSDCQYPMALYNDLQPCGSLTIRIYAYVLEHQTSPHCHTLNYLQWLLYAHENIYIYVFIYIYIWLCLKMGNIYPTHSQNFNGKLLCSEHSKRLDFGVSYRQSHIWKPFQ